MILWLVGLPGAGKSTVGRLVADALGASFVDLDTMIVESSGRSTVAEIFDLDGEEGFRTMEENAVRDLAERGGDLPASPFRAIVATGGGTVLSELSRDLMRASGRRLFLDVSVTVAAERLESSDFIRPLLDQPSVQARLSELCEARRSLYLLCDLQVDADWSTAQVVDATLGLLENPRVQSLDFQTDEPVVQFGDVPSLLDRFDRIRADRRLAIITDSNVADSHRATLVRLAGAENLLYVLPPGESSKSIEESENIVRFLADNEIRRDDLLVGFGGGMVTDLAGFVASVYMRGTGFVAIPTSLLAMVDASVGGKTAINAAGIRNLVGTIRLPEQTMICTRFLETLPEREVRSGLVESLKMGFIDQTELFDRAIEMVSPAHRSPVRFDRLVALSVEAKLGIIGEDRGDRGRRRLLNFGHTVAHALEAVAPDVYSHGEAVAFGMICEARIIADDGQLDLDSERHAGLVDPLLPLTLPTFPDPSTFDDLIDRMRRDKKRGAEAIEMALPIGFDEWKTGLPVEPTAIRTALDATCKLLESYHLTDRDRRVKPANQNREGE